MPDIAALDQYLTFLWAPGERTPSANIRLLGPGEAIREDGRSDRSCWFSAVLCTSRSLNQVESIRGTEQHLRQAVHRQMVADVPVGAFYLAVSIRAALSLSLGK